MSSKETVDLTKRLPVSSEDPRQYVVALATTSNIKRAALESSMMSNVTVECLAVDDPNQIEQPLDHSGLEMARNRIRWVLENYPGRFHGVVAMEDFIQTDNLTNYSVVVIYVVNEGLEYVGYSQGSPLPDKALWEELRAQQPLINGPNNSYGLGRTYGSFYHERYPEVPANNWMAHTAGLDRTKLLEDCFREQFLKVRQDQSLVTDLNNRFRYYPDFPIPGVNFLDWHDIFLDASFMRQLIHYLAKKYQAQHPNRPPIKYVAGLESRGYLIAMPLALELGVGFIPMKKPGKLPHPKVTKTYQKEYGSDTLEMRADLEPGGVIIVDDILATGGSMKAAVDLATEAGHQVVDCLVIRDVPALRAQANQQLGNTPVRILIYDEPPIQS